MSFENQLTDDSQARVINMFHQSIEAKMAAGEGLAPLIEQSSRVIVSRLLNGKKVLSCGNGLSACMASTLIQNLSLRYQMERPGFAAVLLGTDIGNTSAILSHYGPNELFAKQVTDLGNEDDVLVIFSHGDAPVNIIKAIQEAHAKNMLVVCFSSSGDEDITASLANQDCQLHVNNPDRHRVSEIHLVSLYAMCDLIDYQIFGGSNL